MHWMEKDFLSTKTVTSRFSVEHGGGLSGEQLLVSWLPFCMKMSARSLGKRQRCLAGEGGGGAAGLKPEQSCIPPGC